MYRYEFEKKYPSWRTQFMSDDAYNEEYNKFVKEKQKEERKANKRMNSEEEHEEYLRKQREWRERQKSREEAKQIERKMLDDYLKARQERFEEEERKAKEKEEKRLAEMKRKEAEEKEAYEKRVRILNEARRQANSVSPSTKSTYSSSASRPTYNPPPQRPTYNPPPRYTTFTEQKTWSPNAISEGPKISITFSTKYFKHRVQNFDITHLISICEYPNLYNSWFKSGFSLQGNHIPQRAYEIQMLIQNNKPVQLQGELSIYPPLKCVTDFNDLDLSSRAYLIIEERSKQEKPASWTVRDYDGTGINLELTMSDDSVLMFYLPHLIAICENPEEFIRWLRNGRFNYSNENFAFVKRVNYITMNMKNGNSFHAEGKLRTFGLLSCYDDLKGINITQLAAREINALL
ncbi:hypothetical protein GPJ56_007772 [Histomonas meleagridis]|uniref:uncharacterized protein n=1 Tax=Histomonas meleagridis TaxID=135588 RepID=UPI003559C3A7|nr:hypothetical protein GPJ56_007772 [Histomonas meleagridis]KAH0798749.1 hypothetical protein GO595_008614 [Histomonas meleagridis]